MYVMTVASPFSSAAAITWAWRIEPPDRMTAVAPAFGGDRRGRARMDVRSVLVFKQRGTRKNQARNEHCKRRKL